MWKYSDYCSLKNAAHIYTPKACNNILRKAATLHSKMCIEIGVKLFYVWYLFKLWTVNSNYISMGNNTDNLHFLYKHY